MAPIARSRPSSGGGERVSEAASCVGYVGCVDRPGRVGVRALVFVRWAGGFAHEAGGRRDRAGETENDARPCTASYGAIIASRASLLSTYVRTTRAISAHMRVPYALVGSHTHLPARQPGQSVCADALVHLTSLINMRSTVAMSSASLCV